MHLVNINAEHEHVLVAAVQSTVLQKITVFNAIGFWSAVTLSGLSGMHCLMHSLISRITVCLAKAAYPSHHHLVDCLTDSYNYILTK